MVTIPPPQAGLHTGDLNIMVLREGPRPRCVSQAPGTDGYSSFLGAPQLSSENKKPEVRALLTL